MLLVDLFSAQDIHGRKPIAALHRKTSTYSQFIHPIATAHSDHSERIILIARHLKRMGQLAQRR